MGIEQLPLFIRQHYELHEWKHACAILKNDFPDEWNDVINVLTAFRFKKSWITVGGGRKSLVAEWIDRELAKRGWIEKNFQTQVTVDKNVMVKWTPLFRQPEGFDKLWPL